MKRALVRITLLALVVAFAIPAYSDEPAPTLTIPDGLGRKAEIHDLPPAIVEEAVTWLSRRSGAPGRSTVSSPEPSLPQG